MEAKDIVAIVLAALASGGMWTFLQSLITRKDKQKDFVTREDLDKMPAECAVKSSVDELTVQVDTSQHQVAMLSGGIQALLRDKLYHEYNKWSEKGYVPLYARENFENMYNWYHALGKNGVMDDLKDKFLQLPTEEPKKEEQK